MYSAVDGTSADGTLIYIKPTLDGTQPIDIVQYQSVNPKFPHEGTIDQFYGKTQFESYRKLGFNMMKSICEGRLTENYEREENSVESIAELIAKAKAYLKEIAEEKERERQLTANPDRIAQFQMNRFRLSEN